MFALGAGARERLLATFLDLVRIDSPSGEEAACAAYCERVLADAGCTVVSTGRPAVPGSDTSNLVAVLPGTVDGTLTLSAHLDCVEPCRGVEPVVQDGVVTSAGATVLGADDKAGVAAVIESVRQAMKIERRPTIRCVLTVQEEVGLRGAKALTGEDVAGDLCLVLDADGSPGGIVVAAPTHYTFTAHFIGRAAHAGVAPEQGISAIGMAAAAISRLPIGRIDERTTANVGTVHGGSATNVIAQSVEVTGECRSLERAVVERVRAEMDEVMRRAAAEAGGEVDIEWTLEYEGFSVAPDDPALELVRQACEDVGIEARPFSSGGGSDANIIASLGVPTLALSCGMSGVHSTDEELAVDDLVALTEIVVAVIRRLGEAGAGR